MPADQPQIFRKKHGYSFLLSSVYSSYSSNSLVSFVWLAGNLNYYTERILQLHPFARIRNRVLIAVEISLSTLPFPLLNQAQDAKTFQGSVHRFHTDPAQLSHRFSGREAGIGLVVSKFAQTAVDHELRRLERKLKNAVGYFEELFVLDRQTSFLNCSYRKFCGSASAESRRISIGENCFIEAIAKLGKG